MAIISTDAILERLVEETAKSNDHLKAMKELMVSNGGNGNRGGNRDDRPPRRDDERQTGAFTKALKSVFGETKALGSTILGNNGSIQNTVGAVGVSADILADSLGKLPGPIGLVSSSFMQIVSAGTKIYEYMNEQLNMYNTLNSAGVNLSNGMISTRKGAAGAFVSLNDFSTMLSKNSDALAAMDGQYGDGVEQFGRLMNAVQLAQESAGLYGVSQQQLADITARNFKFNKMFSSQEQIRNMNEAQSTQKFVNTLTYLSKTVGKSVDELLNKFNDMGNNLDTGVLTRAFHEQFGHSEEQAAEMTKSFNTIFASMGEAGATLQQLNASKADMFMLPEEYNNHFTQMYTDRIVELQRAGMTDTKQIRQQMSKFVKANKARLDEEIKYQNRAGNVTAAAWLQQIKNIEQTINDPKNNPTPLYENMMQKFNLWIGKNFTEPLNNYFAESQERLAEYLMKVANDTDNAYDFMETVGRDAYNKINETLGGMLNIPAKIFNEIGEFIYGSEYPKVKQAFDEYFDALMEVPKELVKTLWGWATGGDLEEVSAGLRISIKNVFSQIGDSFSTMMSVDISYDDIKERIAESIKAMKNSIFKFWDKLANWWNTDDSKALEERRNDVQARRNIIQNDINKSTPQTVSTPNEYTKPAKIEEPEKKVETPLENSSDLERSQREENVNRLLSSILNSLDNQASQNAQILATMRQVSDNTEPARNV